MTYNLKNDIIFKAFFARKGNEKYLKEFLEALLNIKINEIIIKDEVSLEKLFQEEKGGRIDLLAKIDNEISVNIELQVKKQEDYLERTSLYAAKLISREVGNGLTYKEMSQTILINILDFEIFDTKDYISKSVIVLDKNRYYEIIKNPTWYFIELPKFRKIKPDLDNKLIQWLLFIDDYNKEGIKMAESKNQTLKQARSTMNYLTGDEEIKRLNELRENWAIDRFFDMRSAEKNGEKRGEENGRKKEKLEMAKKMLAKNKSLEEIIELTGLTKEEVEKCAINK